jgi:Leucine-rich repeat (LRR) protein
MQNGSSRKALADRYVMALLLVIGSLLLPLGCGEPTGPGYASLAITTVSLPNARRTVPYADTLAAAGGDSSYTWSVTSGSLPTGLSLTTTTGIISGTPSVEGSSTFTVQVASGDGQVDTQRLSVTVLLVLYPSELCSDYPDSAIVTFEDANLAAAIGTALSVGAQEDLTCSLIAGLTELYAEDLGISSLMGGQNLTGLTSLSLGVNFPTVGTRNSITDIAPLSGLTSLTHLDLSGNSITDIAPLSELTSLNWLNLDYNSISDISVLSGLTGLTWLDLADNSITDVAPLSGLTSLTWLHLSGNSITDISALGGLTSLWSLALMYNSISDISPLSGITSLMWLNLAGNSITDISALSGLTSLTGLALSANSISDISALSGLTSLQELMLRGNSISDISPLSGLTSLRVLNLERNPNLSDIQPLLDNTGLGAGDRVDIRDTNVSCADVAALEAKGVTVQSDCP